MAKKISISLSDELFRKLDERAQKEDKNRSSVVSAALVTYFENGKVNETERDELVELLSEINAKLG